MAGGASADELDLHERLVAGDPVAPAEVFERYLEPVTAAILYGRERGPDTHTLEDAAIDAIESYIERPQQYRPDRLPLLSYLRMAARGDLKNAAVAERRRAFRLVSIDDGPDGVALSLPDGNVSVEEEALEQIGLELPPGLDRAEALRHIRDAFRDPRDLALVRLILDGERRTGPYAAILGIQHLPAGEQKSDVKRHKDRLKKQLQRLRNQLGGSAADAAR